MEKPVFPYAYPTIVSAPLAFVTAWMLSGADKSARADRERAAFDEQYIYSETGIGASEAATH